MLKIKGWIVSISFGQLDRPNKETIEIEKRKFQTEKEAWNYIEKVTAIFGKRFSTAQNIGYPGGVGAYFGKNYAITTGVNPIIDWDDYFEKKFKGVENK